MQVKEGERAREYVCVRERERGGGGGGRDVGGIVRFKEGDFLCKF